MGARNIGVVAVIEPGVEVWSTNRERAVPGGVDPRGGVVVDVTEHLDETTGEILRAFAVVDRHTLRWDVLTEDEIDRSTAQALDTGQLVNLWRRLGGSLQWDWPGHRRRGVATADEHRIIHAIAEFAAVVFGPDGPLYGVLRPPTPGAPPVERPPATFDPSMFVD